MVTVVLLSSSPPRVFARSPTPTHSSSPLPSPNSILKNNVEGRKRFKSASVRRDGFSVGFTTASTLLRTRIGAENLPTATQRREYNVEAGKVSTAVGKGKISSVQRVMETTGALPVPREEVDQSAPQRGDGGIPREETEASEHVTERFSKSRDGALSPLLLEKASSRRLDWTPPAPSASAPAQLSSPLNPSRTFPEDILSNFGFSATASQDAITTQRDGEGGVTKRQRIDFIETGARKTSASIPALELSVGPQAKPAAGSKKRSKDPTQKYTTITGLATSNYSEHELGKGKTNPIRQFLSSTQAREADDSEEPAVDAAKPKPRRVARKAKRTVSKFKVLSPQSAMKALDKQEMMFGSASQLARDESPTFIRDTLEAMRQSESFLMSDPNSSQMTQSISIESTTPRAKHGTARFTKTRNLWAAAGRDEDNALLHVDTVDLFDTPGLKAAFAGKDVLLEPAILGRRTSKPSERQSPSLRGGYQPNLHSGLMGFHDINDITTPLACASRTHQPLLQVRTLHTATSGDQQHSLLLEENAGSSGPQSALVDMPNQSESEKQAPSKVVENPNPKKPFYEGFATHELQKQILAYGFKPIKKREKMIEILDRCWEDKHGEDPTGVNPLLAESIAALTHGDFLSEVHDISSRPVPKVKKPRARTKKDEAATDATAPKSPAKRKKAEPKSKVTATKVSRKRKSNVAVSSEEAVVDVEQIKGLARLQSKDEVAESSKMTSTSAIADDPPDVLKAKVLRKRKPKAKPLSEELIVDVSDVEDSAMEASKPNKKNTTAAEPQRAQSTMTQIPDPASSPASTPDISSQITRAITTYVPEPGRDHRRHPTWHEKILLYDPIVLEDLAAWLNTEGLGRIGEDREVSALEVRGWCEARGVCCLWKGGWRGNGNARGGNRDDEDD